MMLGARTAAWGGVAARDPLEGKNAIVYDILDTEEDYSVTVENIYAKATNNPIIIDWGDGESSSVNQVKDSVSATHTYATAGRYVVTLDGNARVFGNKSSDNKIIAIYWAEGSHIGDKPLYPARLCPRLKKAFWITGTKTFPQYGFQGSSSLSEIGPLDVFTDFSKPESLVGTAIKKALMTNATSSVSSVCMDCTSLEEADIGRATKLISTFSGCSSLNVIRGIENVTSIVGPRTFYDIAVTHLNLQNLELINGIDVFKNSAITGLYLPKLTTIGIACLRNASKCRYFIVPKMSGCTSSTGQMFTGRNLPCEYYGPFIESGDFGIFGNAWWSNTTSAPVKTDADGNSYRVVVEFRAMTCAEIISGERWDQEYNHSFPYGFVIPGTTKGVDWVKFVGSDGYILYRNNAWQTYLYADGYTREDYYAKYLAIEMAEHPEDFE